MITTVEQVTEIVLTAAADMAEKLEMRREEKLDWRTTWDRDLMMLVTAEGIILGRVNIEYGEMRTYKYEKFTLNGVELLEKRYGITENGWEHMPAVTYQLVNGTVIYTGLPFLP
jgi:hypothetical protein